MANNWGGKREGSGKRTKFLGWTEVDLDLVEKLAKEGMTQKEINESHMYSTNAIRIAARNAGRGDILKIFYRNRGTSISKSLLERFFGKKSKKRNAKRFRNPRGRFQDEHEEQIKRMIDNGSNIIEIMEYLGYSKNKKNAYDSKQKRDLKKIITKVYGEEYVEKLSKAERRHRSGARESVLIELEKDSEILIDLYRKHGAEYVCDLYGIKLNTLGSVLRGKVRYLEFENKFSVTGKNPESRIMELIQEKGVDYVVDMIEDDQKFDVHLGIGVLSDKRGLYPELFGEFVTKCLLRRSQREFFKASDANRIYDMIIDGKKISEIMERFGKSGEKIPPRKMMRDLYNLTREQTKRLYREIKKRRVTIVKTREEVILGAKDQIFKLTQKYHIKNGKRNGILQRRIKQELLKIYEEKCFICGIDSWMGKKLRMDMDHTNGDPTDNSLDNLRLLCPNCHRMHTSEQVSLRFRKIGKFTMDGIKGMIDSGLGVYSIRTKIGYKNDQSVKSIVKRYLGEDMLKKMIDNGGN